MSFETRRYRIQRADVRAALRGGTVRVEKRLDGTLAVCFRDRYLTLTDCAPRPQAARVKPAQPLSRKTVRRQSDWMKNFHLGKNDLRPKTPLWSAGQNGPSRLLAISIPRPLL